jgi:hypothetical protein
MQLREAVKIIDVDHIDDPDTHARARSIVDAAVEAHEAACLYADKFLPMGYDRVLFDKLRALERGEEVE